MTHREDAPTPNPGELPEAYVLRVCEYLAEPHRRRLGERTLSYVQRAADLIRQRNTF